MLSMRKILVPIDLWPARTRVLVEAQEFATKFSATIDLLYVYTQPALLAPEVLEWLANTAREQLGKFESQARAEGMAVSASYCEPGDPATAIVERAESGGYDLLVLGTHGRTGLSHLLTGSVAEKVVRRARCAVLTVRTAE